MSWSFRYRPDLGLLVEILVGDTDIDSLLEMKRTEVAHLVGGPDLRIVTDLRRAHVLGDLADVGRFAKWQRKNNEVQRGAALAIVANAPLATALGALYLERLRPPCAGHLFACMGNACHWLGVPFKEVHELVTNTLRQEGYSLVFGAGRLSAAALLSGEELRLCYHADCDLRAELEKPTRCHREGEGPPCQEPALQRADERAASIGPVKSLAT